MTEAPWTAAMITPADTATNAPLLRLETALDEGHGAVETALLRVTAHGIFEATINGRAVSEDVLSPGWSSYEWRLRYRTYDVAHLLEPRFVLGFALGNGWHRGRLGWAGLRAVYGERLGVVAELDIAFADGHRQLVVTGPAWEAGPSWTLADDLYDGQTIDARLLDDAWARPGPAPSGWGPVEVLETDPTRLTPALAPAVRRHEHIAPIAIWRSPAGRTLLDFGQNLVGWLRLRVRGPRGAEVVVRHAEVLEDDELGTRPLRSAAATDRFVLSGGDDDLEPTFTFHGFRYAEITGWPGEIEPGSVEAVVVHTDLQRTGTFACSDELVNQLHRNVVWGFRGNAVDLPTDCPQRDERLGWTGDIAAFAPTAAFLYDCEAFLGDWLLDLAAEQEAQGGRVPLVIPDVLKYEQPAGEPPMFDSPGLWADAAVWVPWALWQAYGDRGALALRFPSMAAHVRYAAARTSPNGLRDSGLEFGDWLDPDAPPDQPWAAKADRRVVSTACLYRSARFAADAAEVLGLTADAEELTEIAERTRTAFNEHYVRSDGTIKSDAATVYALAIVFGLLDASAAERAGLRLRDLVAANGYRIATGFAGTPFVTDALTLTGHVDDAYRLLLERSCPSWLYPVTMGATTIWERWDSMLPDGTINPGGMTSFNHYALGAVADWVHRTIGGIAPAAPGYAEVLVAPRPGGGITWAKTSLRTPHGRVSVDWALVPEGLTIDITLPDGVSALLDLQGLAPRTLASGTHRIVV